MATCIRSLLPSLGSSCGTEEFQKESGAQQASKYSCNLLN